MIKGGQSDLAITPYTLSPRSSPSWHSASIAIILIDSRKYKRKSLNWPLMVQTFTLHFFWISDQSFSIYYLIKRVVHRGIDRWQHDALALRHDTVTHSSFSDRDSYNKLRSCALYRYYQNTSILVSNISQKRSCVNFPSAEESSEAETRLNKCLFFFFKIPSLLQRKQQLLIKIYSWLLLFKEVVAIYKYTVKELWNSVTQNPVIHKFHKIHNLTNFSKDEI